MTPKKRQKYRHLPAFILLLLAEGESYGGAIHAALSDRLPEFQGDTAAIYRSLQKLEQDGEVKALWDTANSGPARKIYTLTVLGWQRLDEWQTDIKLRLANLQYFLDSYQRVKANRE